MENYLDLKDRRVTSMNEYQKVIKRQKRYFQTGRTKPVLERIRKLNMLYQWIEEHEKDILRALKEDLNKPEFETYMTEIGVVKEELRYIRKNIKRWSAPKKVKTPMTQFPSVSYIYREPYGVVLIMAPWNYPFQLSVIPLAEAVAAGNCVVLKPSAYASATSRLLGKMAEEVFAPYEVKVVEGGRKENEFLLGEKFDYIFFTGSKSVGSYVMKKAAEHLTPVTLELGGKSPCIVDETADIKKAAKRIVWGKFLNAGQTCVAPDYIWVHRNVKEKLIKAMEKYIRKMYGEKPHCSETYPSIINAKHFERLEGLMVDGKVIFGGRRKKETLKIEPTIMDEVTWDSPVMREEIFGPILPILSYYDIKEVIYSVRAGQKPLALYYFTKDKRRRAAVIKHLSFGGGCINDTIVHLSNVRLPFGGVGASGMGSYHGKAGFETFTHKKSVLKKSFRMDIPMRYAPHKKGDLWMLKRFM